MKALLVIVAALVIVLGGALVFELRDTGHPTSGGPDGEENPAATFSSTAGGAPDEGADAGPTPLGKNAPHPGRIPPAGNPEAKPAPAVPPQLADRLRDFNALEESSENRANSAVELANAWANIDPAGALAWAAGLEKGLDRAAAQNILRSWSASDPAGALEHLDALGDGDFVEHATRYLLDRWSDGDPSAAWEAAGSIGNPDLRAEAEAEILMNWARSDPGATADILGQTLSIGRDPEPLLGVFQTTGADFARADPGAAADWVARLPDGEAKAAALNGLMASWTSSDPGAASAWLRELAPGAARDSGVTALIHSVRREDPAGALAWAETIGDPRMRERISETVALSWLAKNPDSARTAIAADPNLSAAAKAKIFAAFEEQRAIESAAPSGATP